MFRIMLLLLLLVPFVSADSMDVSVELSQHDIVTEHFVVSITADESFDSFEYVSATRPFSVVFDGEYVIAAVEDGFAIRFLHPIVPGENVLEFSLLFDDLIARSGGQRSFRTNVQADIDSITLKVFLPEHFVLSTDPAVFPLPKQVSTDGQRIMLSWDFEREAGVALFYEGGQQSYWGFVVGAIIVLIIASLIFLGAQRRANKKIDLWLSPDERAVLDQVKNGIVKQQVIAENLGFSKSKMSKVMRKLEEKLLVSKTPHFKTNIIKLKK